MSGRKFEPVHPTASWKGLTISAERVTDSGAWVNVEIEDEHGQSQTRHVSDFQYFELLDCLDQAYPMQKGPAR